MIGIGFSQSPDTTTAVNEIVQTALQPVTNPQWGLLVVGRHHDPGNVVKAIRRQLPGLVLHGGSAVGAIGSRQLGYSGYEIQLLLFGTAFGMPRMQRFDYGDESEFQCGERIGDWLNESTSDSPSLLFYDVPHPAGRIHFGSRLLDGIHARLAGRSPAVFGAGLITDFEVSDGYLIVDGEISRNSALMIQLPAEIAVVSRIMHACNPVSSQLEVTAVRDECILELDGRPALARLREIAGTDVAFSFSILLGRTMGNSRTGNHETEFVNRLIIAIDETEQSVSLFEPDIAVGDRVQVMVRDNDLLMRSIDNSVRDCLKELDGRSALVALYIDCAGRASVFTGSDLEESEHLAELLGDIPLFGFFVGREIAPFGERSRPLDWTGVLMLLTKRG